MPVPDRPVSRAYAKLAAALDHFNINVSGSTCADFGCNVGGFTHCLLARGATRVYAVDTSTKLLNWNLRRDEHVVVLEGTNALYAQPPEPVDLVAIDVGWTRQALILPAAHRWVVPGGTAVTLIKPHYEANKHELMHGRLPAERVDAVVELVLTDLRAAGQWEVIGTCDSPIVGGSGGNREILAYLKRLPVASP